MKKSKMPLALFLVLFGGVASLYMSQKTDPPSEQPMEPIPQPETQFEQPEVQFTVPEYGEFVAPDSGSSETEAEKKPTFELPELAQSDEPIKRSLAAISDSKQFLDWLLLNNIVNRFVVTVDNIPTKSLPNKYRMLKQAPGSFMAKQIEPGEAKDSAGEKNFVLDPGNEYRYRVYIKLLQSLNMQSLLRMYVQYYPLFQQAYEELGYPDRYFNNRFIEVIEHMLNTPDVTAPLELKQPKVFYLYADDRYENLSAGQKTLLRMGQTNARQVKDFLQSLKQELVALSKVTVEKAASNH